MSDIRALALGLLVPPCLLPHPCEELFAPSPSTCPHLFGCHTTSVVASK